MVLTPDDLIGMRSIAETRMSFQNETGMTKERHEAILHHLLDLRIGEPTYIFLGYYSPANELVAFASFNRLPFPYQYNIGAAWALPGLPRFPGSHAAGPLVEIRNFATTYFREKEFMQVAWNVRPNRPEWLKPAGADLMDSTKYKMEIYQILPPNQKLADPDLQSHVMLSGTLPEEQAILKFTDLNPIPYPDYHADFHASTRSPQS